MTYLGVPSIATIFSIVFIFLFSFYTPLHVSAFEGHLQVEYTHSLMKVITPTTNPFLGYATYTYISLASYKKLKKKIKIGCYMVTKSQG
jgi:hypothetical protein